MFSLSGSHKRRPDLGPTREAERPVAVTRADFESAHVVIGSSEPAEGRYTTLSRLTYKHGAGGDESSCVASAATLKADARKRALENQTRNFSLPLDDNVRATAPTTSATRNSNNTISNINVTSTGSGGSSHSGAGASKLTTAMTAPPMLSEVHQAQQSSRDILDAYNRRHARGAFGVFREEPSPARLARTLRAADTVTANIQQASDMTAHMQRMNATSIVEGAGADAGGADPSAGRSERAALLQSTHRTSYEQRDSASAVAERKERAHALRMMHHQSSATPIEDTPTRWSSEVRSSFATKVTPAPPPLCTTAQKQHLKLDDADGRAMHKSGDALKSLYMADLKMPPPSAAAALPVISWHKHQISLGSDSRATASSLYRASFTPTVFVQPKK